MGRIPPGSGTGAAAVDLVLPGTRIRRGESLEFTHDANFPNDLADTDEMKTRLPCSGTDTPSVADAVESTVDGHV